MYKHRVFMFACVICIIYTMWPSPKLVTAQEISSSFTAQSDGMYRVIVQLRDVPEDESTLSRSAIQSRRQIIAQKQQQVITELAQHLQDVRTYVALPALAIKVDQQGLSRLQQSPLVEYIQMDEFIPLAMDDSNQIIGAQAASIGGNDGSGMVVAVIDSGVQHRDRATGALRPHKMLQNQVVAEACFNMHDPALGVDSTCKNNATRQTFQHGAAAPCDHVTCDHGTHVAATIAGNPVMVYNNLHQQNRQLSGVAPKSKIIAIQAFHTVDNDSICGSGASPCVLTSESSYIAALDWLYINRNDSRFQGKLVAVNMSLGGGYYQTFCDAQKPLVKRAIDNLRQANIATIVAAGNNGYIDGISTPACISSAIAVGATLTSNATSGIPDRVASFSNTPSAANNTPNSANNYLLDLMAPGEIIYSAKYYNSGSSTPTEDYDGKQGTSMAAPHVAGAWAAIRSANPNANVNQVLAWLRNTGVPVTSKRSKTQIPRIDVAKAVTVARNIGKSHTLSTYAIEFGKVGRGTTSSHVITVRNTSAQNITMTRQLTNPVFRISNTTCGNSLRANSSCTITVSYQPTANHHMKLHTAVLTVRLQGISHKVGLSGTSVLYEIKPSAYDFGALRVGTAKAIPEVRLVNYSTNVTAQFIDFDLNSDPAMPNIIDLIWLFGPTQQYPDWFSKMTSMPALIGPASEMVILTNFTFAPTYASIPDSSIALVDEYACYVTGPNGTPYGSCVERPGVMYFLLDTIPTDGNDCSTPTHSSCIWTTFHFTGQGVVRSIP